MNKLLESNDFKRIQESKDVMEIVKKDTTDNSGEIRYHCDITNFLWFLNPYTTVSNYYDVYLYDCGDKHPDIFAIRTPCRTIGFVECKDGRIQKCKIHDDYIIKEGYPENINELLAFKFFYRRFNVISESDKTTCNLYD